MTSTKMVSIVIVNYNGKTHLEKCLQSLMEINYASYEVILVDNNSTDGGVEFVHTEYPKVKIIKLDKNYGFAEPNNIGAKSAKGEYLLFLNNDTVATPNFVTELVDVMNQDPQIAICQSMLLKPNGDVDSSGDFIDTLGRAYSSRNRPTEVQYILSARGASMMVKKNAFWDLGGFDKNFFASFEDVDIGWRAWLWGYKVVLVPNSTVYHIGGQTIKTLNSVISFHGVKNTLLLRLVNFEISYVTTSIPLLFFVILLRKIFGVTVIKDPEQGAPLPSFKIMLHGIIWILKNFKYVITKRKQINSRRVRSTDDLIEEGVITKYSF